METPNAVSTMTAAGKTAAQAEFEAGLQLKREGKALPDDASDAARKGYESEDAPPLYPTAPGVATIEPEKNLTTHKTAVVAQTDRPEPTTTPADAGPLNPNENVSITIDKPGERYLVEGKGASVAVDFANDVTEESLIAVVIDRLRGMELAADNYCRNAANDLEKGLEWLKIRVRERLKAKGVTSTTTPPAP